MVQNPRSGDAEIAAVDSRDSHVLEILGPGLDGDWTNLLHFTVFEVDPHYEGQRGVVYDRILLYPQTD